MPKGVFSVPLPTNEPVLTYAPNTPERQQLKAALAAAKAQQITVPMYIGGKQITTDNLVAMRPPHEHAHILGHFYKGNATHVQQAIEAALAAKPDWEDMAWEHRIAIFLKAAELIAGPYRARINAATMLGQSKNAFQAEIDSACELADFLRFNAHYAEQIYQNQPGSSPGVWNRMEYRPLEGFVVAITPFNFTAIAGNLPSSPAMMGNTVVWKPAETQIFSAQVIMEVFRTAGLPDGVINLVFAPGPDVGAACFAHPEFAGIHFTGSTGTFQYMWRTIGQNISNYKSYPRIVGETGGKDFVFAHPSANPAEVATALSRGAFEYQGQKCSAASRAYLPSNMHKEIIRKMAEDIAAFKMGTVENFGNFINAVIDEKSFNSITKYIDDAHQASGADVIIGGNYNKSTGYFIEPTVILTNNPHYTTMCEEIFGPVLTVYVYDENKYNETLQLVNNTSPYALTGAFLATDRKAIEHASKVLRHAAGNFYINDKPTGAVVNQQPFGGARASGTNDKAGSYLNLIRWVSPRVIKENFVPPTDFRYPFLNED
ncbi:MAG: L-glutamate gamma-semialdehyde dehydrogenase [Sphingobacteriales bacterium]|jgi:1-pyrroline-5-carboxylate dehydrogenase|nr:L-glutamate gamma-semialdehyde dehydrogenase [Sphingobacteriales bacterium]MBP9142047.1 L-glutamate gamma-semialdehyde dehydrogenase [Chitinophagales bacterium]MBK6889619.1 L-glutamate gamma-semialdehyde dehydrogenase [Sphingobacteriales bacterium]MBK7527870.1 L-glutamate gamma-semialdehyde dehydrogenase [Sphingobacteriales bacterium]MBK8678856.1 L-glutamate gamma-semialdehyde dehydrogenase [Sphingobacteriales bacterium]